MSGAGGHPSAWYDVFLSHSSADKPWVRTLSDALQAAGLAVFLDEQQLAAPRNFVGQLSDALRAKVQCANLSWVIDARSCATRSAGSSIDLSEMKRPTSILEYAFACLVSPGVSKQLWSRSR